MKSNERRSQEAVHAVEERNEASSAAGSENGARLSCVHAIYAPDVYLRPTQHGVSNVRIDAERQVVIDSHRRACEERLEFEIEKSASTTCRREKEYGWKQDVDLANADRAK